jgi:integrase
LDWRFDGLTALVSIAAGKAAALVVLAGNRAKNIDDVERVETVFKDGVGYDRIMLPHTKNGGRIVYLNKSAQAVVASLPFNAETKTTDKLFQGITPDMVTVTFRRVCVAVEILDFRFHDLRHTASSWLRMQGEDIHTVAQLLGHKDLRMAARYQHLSPTFLATAVGKPDTAFGDLSHQGVTTPKALPATMSVSD